MTRTVNAIFYRPDLGGFHLSLESIEPTFAAITAFLGCSRPDLRVLRHEAEVYIGFKDDTVNHARTTLCPAHEISLRGPTLIFSLDATRIEKNSCLNDVLAREDADQNMLPLIGSFIKEGDGYYELMPFEDGTETDRLPHLPDRVDQEDAATRREKGQRLAEILKHLIGAPTAAGTLAEPDHPINSADLDDCPPELNSVFELTAMVMVETPETFPAFGPLVSSLFSFWIEELRARIEAGVIDKARACRLMDAAQDLHAHCTTQPAFERCYIVTHDNWKD